MKKSTIVALAVIMGVSFASLLIMQVRYIDEISDLRHTHFEESVTRSLSETVHQLGLEEARWYLEQGTATTGYETASDSAAPSAGGVHQVIIEDDAFGAPNTTIRTSTSDKFYTKKNNAGKKQVKSLKEIMDMRYAHEKKLLDEVIYNILYTASDRPIEERIDFIRLDQILKTQLTHNGINIPYHFCVRNSSGQVVYRCPDYEETGSRRSYEVALFETPMQQSGTLAIHFPDLDKYIWRSVWFIMPSIVLAIIQIVTFIITLALVFRQKKLTELKNDFINNMTHEFKTPISSISLAAQMLSDESVKKTPVMLNRLTSTISDETKRLRFQVEKVLQLSMYENQRANLHMKEVNINELINSVTHTFALKVEKNHGKIVTNLKAADAVVYGDGMHLTNVIFNLMDNAVKYKRKDADLELNVETWNEPGLVCVSIQDNGIGIKKEDLKRIFEKFYRVHTGNLHDVKGFGLGLAYVHKIVTDHKGTIVAESEPGFGTTFIIKLKNNA